MAIRRRLFAIAFAILVPFMWMSPRTAMAQEAPVITLQPVGSTNLTATEVEFVVQATGTAPLFYQWYFNITNRLAGEINSSILYTNVGEFQEGFFSVVITNAFGAVTSNPVFLSIQVPPLVTREPTNVVAAVGGTAIFSVDATGDPPLLYQWYKNIIEVLDGATNATLILTNLQKTNTGSYQIEVSNDYDTVNSREVFLTVKDPPFIAGQPANAAVPAGSPVTFSATVTGDGPLTYRWFFNDTNQIFGVNTSSLTIANAQLANIGTYTLTVASDVGSVTSAPASLLVLQAPVITVQPVSTSTTLNSNATFSVAAVGTSPLTYQWYFNRSNVLDGATQSSLFITNAQLTNAGIYSVVINNQSGSVTSINASLSVFVPPQIVSQTSNITARAGQSVFLTVSATGTAPLIYRWFLNGSNFIAGASGSTLSLPNVQLAAAGVYTAVVSNIAGTAASSPINLNVQSPPVIVRQPVSRAILPGDSATFSVQAVGDAPLAYQWFYNSTTFIPGANGPELTINNAQSANNGRYSVRITNVLGSAISAEATLAVKLPPNIVQNPASMVLTQGNTATFTVSVIGDGPFGFRWFLNATNPVPGINSPVLEIENVQAANAGRYSVVVTNEVGQAVSAEAVLDVRTPPAITRQPLDTFAAPGGIALFSTIATGDAPLRYQWFFNGSTPIAGGTNADLALQNVNTGAVGTYRVTISNHIGTVTSRSATLGIRQPPVVTTQPVSQIATQGGSATFSVVVSGDGPFGYEWQRNNAPIPAANGPTLTLNNVQPVNGGDYVVRVTNLVGSAVSDLATLTIRTLPVITQHPVSLVATQGQTATFTVAATSDSPVTYQWRHNGIALASTTASLQISAVTLGNAGTYDVITRNTYGAVTSSIANLTVFGVDFGDAPSATYPTLLASDGARHVIVPGVFLGIAADPESDAQAGLSATGDDSNGIDDEDGVRWNGAWHVGLVQSIEVIASTAGSLNAWLDLDRAGEWTAAGEQIVTNAALVAGMNVVSFPIPSGASIGTTFARFRFSTANGLGVTGLAPDGEVEDYEVTLAPTADIVLSQAFDRVETAVGNPAVLVIGITNTGPSTATGLFVTNQLSPRATFLGASASLGSCEHLAGMVICDLGTLPSGEGATITIETTVGPGLNTHLSSVHLNELDPTPAAMTSAVVGTGTSPIFANNEIIIMPLPDAGAATPYPSPVVVSGITAAVHQVKVTLLGLTHDYPDDIDMLLVGPGGQSVILMSDAGFDNPIADAVITFDAAAGQTLPDSGLITSGSYIPSNYPPPNENFPPPAPSGVQTSDLAQFRGTDPNGLWSLYVVDDATENGGSDLPGFIADGWTLTFVTSDPLADLGVSAQAAPSTVSIGEPIVYTLSITNFGPTPSHAFCGATLPSNVQYLSASTPQGACGIDGQTVTCDVGILASGGGLSLDIEVTASVGGNIDTVFSVSGSQLDLNASNNFSTATHFVRPMIDLAVSASPPTGPVLLNQPRIAIVLVTNRGPNEATGVWVTNQLPAGATYLSSTSLGSCTASGQTVTCSLGTLAVATSSQVAIEFIPGTIGSQDLQASAIGTEIESEPADNSAVASFTVSPATDLGLRVVNGTGTVPQESNYTITFEITNRGPISATAYFTNQLPPSHTFVSAFPSRGSCTNHAGIVTCQFPDLASNEAARVLLQARANTLGSTTNAALVTGSVPDNQLTNNIASAAFTVVPNANLSVSIVDRPSPVWLGDNLNYSIQITNQGPSSSLAVVLTNQLAPGVTFISAQSSQGTCSQAGTLVRCDIGTLAANATANVAVTVRPAVTGFVSLLTSVSSLVSDGDLTDNQSSATTRVITGNIDLATGVPIATPLLGLANPYPSTISVSGVSSAIHRIRVSLLNLSHSFADDLDILLVGPDGRATFLMSDCGGEFPANGVTLTFDDNATNTLGDFTSILSGTVRPANHGLDVDSFAAPAPTGPYATNLSIFNGTNPNGTWSLYVMDDSDKDSGIVAGGWRLTISAFEPMADLGLAQSAAPTIAGTGSNVVFTYTVTNRGPSIANSIRLTNAIPESLSIIAFNNPNGACTVAGGLLVCDVGSLPPGGTAALTVTSTSLVPGVITNLATISSAGVDVVPSNNVASTVVTFDLPPVITLQPASQPATLGGTVQFITTAVGAAPLSYRWQKDGVDIPGATSASLNIVGISIADAGTYRVRVSNNVGSVLSDPAQILIPGPPTISAVADQTIDEDTITSPIVFTIQDFDTPASALTLSGSSSNPALVNAAGFTFGGTAQNRTIVIRPIANQSGTAVIQLVVQDSTGASATNSFNLNVRPVIDPIVILQQPRNVLAVTGAPVTLSITATSSIPITYQWQRNGQPISGATLATLQFPNIAGTNAGSYAVIASNGDTNLTSTTITVTVTNQLPRPQVISILQNGSTATVTFSTAIGLNYTLEFKSLLTDSSWTALSSTAGTGNAASLSDTNATRPTRFYRVRAE